MSILEAVLVTIVTASTPLLIAAIGELVVERSGVLNLGVEGMMVVGAVVGFVAGHLSGVPVIGILAAILAGVAMASVFAVATLVFVTNQVASGLALTIMGLGLAALIGDRFVSVPGLDLGRIHIPVLTDIPIVGPLIFGEDPLVYFAIALTIAVSWFLFRTRAGLILRAVGDNHGSAHALGYPVIRVRFLAVLFGGACAGLAGAYLSIVYTPQWIPNMTAGRGWIAVALVVFAGWRPYWLLAGAYFFGLLGTLELYAKASGGSFTSILPSEGWAAVPYLATVVALAIISASKRAGGNAPACLGKPFIPAA